MNRRVFVTGGANGIGKAIVKAFLEYGDRVAFCDTDESGHEFAESCGARFFRLDVSDAEALDQLMLNFIAEWGDIDVLINNVGVCVFKPLYELAVEEFDKIIDINMRSVFVTSRRMAIHRKSLGEQLQDYGRIINMCSTRYLMSEKDTEAYSASKGGVYSLTHSLAVSLSPLKITVNSISPGWIENYHYSELSELEHSQHPSGRVGKPDDIASVCVFLAKEENDFINGENIVVDGGMTKRMIYPSDLV